MIFPQLLLQLISLLILLCKQRIPLHLTSNQAWINSQTHKHLPAGKYSKKDVRKKNQNKQTNKIRTHPKKKHIWPYAVAHYSEAAYWRRENNNASKSSPLFGAILHRATSRLLGSTFRRNLYNPARFRPKNSHSIIRAMAGPNWTVLVPFDAEFGPIRRVYIFSL